MGLSLGAIKRQIFSPKGAVVGCVGLIGVSLYPVVFAPLWSPEEYRKIQDVVREGLDRETIQPGGMRIWSDPYEAQNKNESEYLQKKRAQKTEEERQALLKAKFPFTAAKEKL